MDQKLAHVQILYVGMLTGEPGFGRKLIECLQGLERFELTGERSGADAVLEAHGEDQEDGFFGQLKICDLRGTVLWSAQALRPHGAAGPMAYERLIAELRAALPPTTD